MYLTTELLCVLAFQLFQGRFLLPLATVYDRPAGLQGSRDSLHVGKTRNIPYKCV